VLTWQFGESLDPRSRYMWNGETRSTKTELAPFTLLIAAGEPIVSGNGQGSVPDAELTPGTVKVLFPDGVEELERV